MATDDDQPPTPPVDRDELKTIRLTEEEKRQFMDQAITKKAPEPEANPSAD